MTPFALALVLTAALTHATWNFYAKQVSGGAPFVWLFSALAACLYAPLALGAVIVQEPQLGVTEVLFILGSAALHVAYFLVLQQGYRVGELSLVYPLARGTGPLLSTVAAIVIFAERPTPVALIGASLVVVGVFLLAGGTKLVSRRNDIRGHKAVVFGLFTGTLIAAYTLWDKQAVGVLLIPPLLFDWTSNVGRALLLTPVALRNRELIRATWKEHRRATFIVATLSPLSYILVLTALTFSPVSYIAPAREVSILVGVAMGAGLLHEGEVGRRLGAASLIVLGIVALALG